MHWIREPGKLINKTLTHSKSPLPTRVLFTSKWEEVKLAPWRNHGCWHHWIWVQLPILPITRCVATSILVIISESQFFICKMVHTWIKRAKSMQIVGPTLGAYVTTLPAVKEVTWQHSKAFQLSFASIMTDMEPPTQTLSSKPLPVQWQILPSSSIQSASSPNHATLFYRYTCANICDTVYFSI